MTPGRLYRRLAKARGRLLLVTLCAGALAVAFVFLSPPTYRATAVLRPVASDDKPARVSFDSVMSPIGVAQAGSATLEALVLLFRSRDLTRRVFRTQDLRPMLFGPRFDPARGTLEPTLWDRVFHGQKVPGVTGDWDAVRAAESRLQVSADLRLGTVKLSFDSLTPAAARTVLEHYLDSAMDHLQEEALGRERRTAAFLASQIARSDDPSLTRNLYDLYAEAVRREMLAHNRQRFGFTVVDEPSVSTPRAGRAWAKTAALASLGALLVAFFYHLEPAPARRRSPRQAP